jgi:hypothetical protein
VIDLNELESYDLKNIDREFIEKEATRAKFRLLGLLSQRHNIVIHIRKLSARTNYFKKLVKKIILINNRTRWNSWYNMFFIFFELKGIVKQYYKDYESKLKENILSYIDWKKLRTIKDFLVSFSRVTFIIKRDSVSINRTLFIMDVLIKHF